MDRKLLKDTARPATRINLGHRTFEVRAKQEVGPFTPNEVGDVLTARHGSTVKVTQTGPRRYRYEVKSRCSDGETLGVLSATQGGVGVKSTSGCVIKVAAEKAGWAGVASGRSGKIDVEAGEGDVQIDFGYSSDGIGSVTAHIETQRGKITVKDERPRRMTPFGVQFPYYQGSLVVVVNRAGGSVDVLIGNSEDEKSHVVIVTVDGKPYPAGINGDKLSVGVGEQQLQILVDDVAVVTKPLAPSN